MYSNIFNGAVSAGTLCGIDTAVLKSPECKNLVLELPTLESAYANSVAASKKRDDTRGMAVIPDYAKVNKSMRQDISDGGDAVICNAKNRAIAITETIEALFMEK